MPLPNWINPSYWWKALTTEPKQFIIPALVVLGFRFVFGLGWIWSIILGIVAMGAMVMLFLKE